MKTVFSRVQSKRGRRLASASSLHMYPIAYIQPTCTHTHTYTTYTVSSKDACFPGFQSLFVLEWKLHPLPSWWLSHLQPTYGLINPGAP